MVVSVLVAVSLHPAAAFALVASTTGIILPILGGLLYGKVETIKNNVNGNLTRMMDIIERQGQQLAVSVPPVER
jgi:hypothetical protein